MIIWLLFLGVWLLRSGMFDLQTTIESIGFLGIAAIVFSESGLFIGAVLPGDSLLFTAGFLASQGILDIRILIPVCFIAAVAGDSFGYAFGRKVGPWIFKREDSFLFHKEHVARAQRFYEKHGGKTIIIARFMPFVRTFAPILAGVGNMHYPRFLAFNVIGGFLWAVGLSAAGYILGNTVPGVDRYLLPIVLVIILASVAPTAWHVLKDRAYRTALFNSFKKFIAQTRGKRHPPLHSPLPRGETKRNSPPPNKGEDRGGGVSTSAVAHVPIPPDYRNTGVIGLNNVMRMLTYAPEAKKEFTERSRGKQWFHTDMPLRQKTTYCLGGPSDFFLTPKTLEDTQAIIIACRDLHIPLFVLGGGSNVLFSDKGWRGVVLQPSNINIVIDHTSCHPELDEGRHDTIMLRQAQHDNDKNLLTRWEMINHNRPIPPKKPEIPLSLPLAEVIAGAGTSLQQLIIKTHQEKLVGLESFSGIPARVGGALRNNIHGGPDNFDRYVKEATLINIATGATEIWPKEKFEFSYDHSILQQSREWLVWDVTLLLPQADDALWQQFNAFFKSWQTYKAQTQTSAGTGGCVFKNIDPAVARAKHIPVSAGALIDQMFGLGAQLRTAQISTWHGNFLQNTAEGRGPSRLPVARKDAEGGLYGSSDDMLSLINFIREELKQRNSIDLEMEIELVGF
jgi:membrane-associated protein